MHRDVFGENADNAYSCSRETLKLLRRLEYLQGRRSDLVVELNRLMGELGDAYAACGKRRGYRRVANRMRWRIVRDARRAGVRSLEAVLGADDCVDEGKELTKKAFEEKALDWGDSEGGSFFEQSPLRIGLIADEFNVRYLSDAVHVVLLNPDNYREVIGLRRVDVVVYMSSWRGAGSIGGVRVPEAAPFYGPAGRFLAKTILAFSRSCGISTVFQSIEDPPSYKVFLDVARSADFVFTSCEEMVGRYKQDTGNDRVFVAKYGINPLIHNPVGMLRKFKDPCLESSVLFAGAWYKRFKRRCRDLQMIFDGVKGSPVSRLVILDRNLYSTERGDGRVFPVRYADCILPPVGYKNLQAVHKLFDWTVNVNSVVDSKTMCARRVYEVQALGCLVLSNYSQAVEAGFPGVFIVRESIEVGRILEGYSRRERINIQIENVRLLYSGCTVYDRMNEMFGLVGKAALFRAKPVYILYERDRAAALRFSEGQEFSDLILVSAEEAQAGRLESGYFAFFDQIEESDRRNPHFIMDMVNAFKYVTCDYVRYADEERVGEAFEYETGSAGGSSLCALSSVDVSSVLAGSPPSGLKGFVIAREQWGRSAPEGVRQLGVVVPVFGNEEFLWGRCIRSLMRSGLFDSLSLYLVDGRPPAGCRYSLERIGEAFGNVVVVPLGNATVRNRGTARAMGVCQVKEPYFTLLEPEDEVACIRFAELVRNAVAGSKTVVVGAVWESPSQLAKLRKRQLVRKVWRRFCQRYSREVRGVVYSTGRFAHLAAQCIEEGRDFDEALSRSAHLAWRKRVRFPVLYAGSKEVRDVRI